MNTRSGALPDHPRLRRGSVCQEHRQTSRRQESDRPIETTGELNELIKAAIPAKMRANGGHPSNGRFRPSALSATTSWTCSRTRWMRLIGLLNPGGRICIITFHSLEDRIVKSAFRKMRIPAPARRISRYVCRKGIPGKGNYKENLYCPAHRSWKPIPVPRAQS